MQLIRTVLFSLLAVPAQAANELIWPVDGWVLATTLYIDGTTHFYGSADIGAPHWTRVVAARSGTVSASGYDPAFATNMIVINHSDSYQTQYGHLVETVAKTGDVVVAGQTIGYIGRIGVAVNPHLHFAIFLDPIGPTAMLPISGLALGAWTTRGKFIPGTYSPMSAISEVADSEAFVITHSQDAYTSADASSTVICNLAQGTRLQRTDSSLGFLKATTCATDVWVPISGLLPMPRDPDPLPYGAFGEQPFGGTAAFPVARGIVKTMRTTTATPAYALANGQGSPLWLLPADTLVTAFYEDPSGWTRIMDTLVPRSQGAELVLGQLTWVASSALTPVETFMTVVATNGVVVRDAPDTDGAAMHTYRIDASASWITATVHSVVNGWFQIQWLPGGVAWLPGWQTTGRK